MRGCEFDIYAGNGKVRFCLGKSGLNPLFIIGTNPSNADRYRSDPTIKKVEALCGHWHFDGFVMLNLYPIRSSNISQLPDAFDSEMAGINLEVLQTLLCGKRKSTVWAAWGDAVRKRPYFLKCLRSLEQVTMLADLDWRCCGELTNKREPRHPNPREQPISRTVRRGLLPFDFKGYLGNHARSLDERL